MSTMGDEVDAGENQVAVRERRALELAEVPGEGEDLVLAGEGAPHVGPGFADEEAELGLPDRAQPGDQPGAHAIGLREPRQRLDQLLAGIDPQRPAVRGAAGLHSLASCSAQVESPSFAVRSKKLVMNSGSARPVSSHTPRTISSSEPAW